MEMTTYAPGTPSWVDLAARDLAAATTFYRGLFGWDCFDSGPDAGGYVMCYLRDKPVAGLGPAPDPNPVGHSFWTTYVSVSDADTTAKAVAAAGGRAVVEPMDVLTVGRMGVFVDPTGASFAVWQARDHIGAGLVNEPGAVCWNELTTRGTDAAISFYTAVFGWEASPLDMGGAKYTEWKVNGQTVAGMMPMDDAWPADLPSHWMVYFAVDDTDAAAAKAQALGGTVAVPPTDIPPGRFSVLTDPQGAVFSIIKMSHPPVPS